MPIPEGMTVKFARRELKQENARFPRKSFLLLEGSEVDKANVKMTVKVARVWRSRRFLVQEYVAAVTGEIRLTIQRTWCDDDGEWSDGITWDEIQWIKDSIGFKERCAIEIYPPHEDIVNIAALRHVWVLPRGEAPKFMWRDGSP